MKNKALIYLLIAGGVYWYIAKSKKPKYKITVPEPEKITAEQYSQQTKGLVQKIIPVAKKVISKIKAKKAAKKIGEFPCLY